MPIDPQTQQLAQLLQQIKQGQAQQLLSGQSMGGGRPPQMTMPTYGGPGAIGNVQGPGPQTPPVMAPPSGTLQPPQPQTLGFNRPVPMQMPDPDPQGQQQQQAPDIALGMSLGDIPSG